jgi:ribosomal protein S18 acetylase RimI-like enzyme
MAEVIDRAFGASLATHVPNRSARLRMLADGVNRAAVIGGYLDEHLVGVIGTKAADKWVFDTMVFELLRRELGTGALRARLAIALLDRPLEPGTIRIEFVAVDDHVLRLGVGRALLGAAAVRACELEVSRLELHVEPGNTEAFQLYARVGFQGTRAAHESLLRRTLAPQTDRRMIKELMCTTS